jgi:AAA15 family ATPase/GTPase
MEVPILKQAAIYGANGAGKSNFIKAVIFLHEFVTRKNFLKSINWNDYIFQLTKEKLRTISFEIEFFIETSITFITLKSAKKKFSKNYQIQGLEKQMIN